MTAIKSELPITELSGFAHGVGLFETFAIEGTRVAFFDEHWGRLVRSAEVLGLPIKAERAKIVASLRDFLSTAPDLQNKALKLTLYEVQPGTTQLTWSLRPKRVLNDSVRERLNVSTTKIHHEAELTGHKTLNYWTNRRGLEKAAQAHCIDSVVVNTKDTVADCWASNLFIIQGESILTPPLEDGPLPGIVREILLRESPSAGLNFSEQSITLEDIKNADAVFITNSLIGVQAIQTLVFSESTVAQYTSSHHASVQTVIQLYQRAYEKSLSALTD